MGSQIRTNAASSEDKPKLKNMSALYMEEQSDQIQAVIFLAKVPLLQNISVVANLHNSLDLYALPGCE